MIYIYIILMATMACRYISNKLKQISHELDLIKQEFYFVGSNIDRINEKNNYIQNTLYEIEQDYIQNYKHLDDKIHVYNRYIIKELKELKQFKETGKDITVDIFDRNG